MRAKFNVSNEVEITWDNGDKSLLYARAPHCKALVRLINGEPEPEKRVSVWTSELLGDLPWSATGNYVLSKLSTVLATAAVNAMIVTRNGKPMACEPSDVSNVMGLACCCKNLPSGLQLAVDNMLANAKLFPERKAGPE